MEDRLYSEAELRQRLLAKSGQFASALTGRLRDDGFFEPVNIRLRGTLRPDGTVDVDSEPLFAEVRKRIDSLVIEMIPALLVVLFDET